ncbi:LamG domain-containing protein [Pedobacter faecalis]|uniref:LamG domain-containing protein n=1 Tax=Pedobacter faecalis TaxID=3041495 RepID=UPI002550CC35|nr:LamG domain-containing protein [Pedobacter sp. ELA7]
MKNFNIYMVGSLIAMASVLVVSCKETDNPNNLPEVDPRDYEGKIEGYNNADEVYPRNLKAHWTFDDINTEVKTGTAPTQTANASYVAGVKGKAIRLENGYLYYATQLPAFKTDSLKSFTISTWVQILNNGSKRTMLFQLARPGQFNGSINFILNTNAFPASNTNELKINPTFVTVTGGTQDNVNTERDKPGQPNYFPYLTPKIGANKWTHIALTYESATGLFYIWADGRQVGAFSSRGVGNSLFKAYEPSEIIIGGNYNVIPGKAVNADTNFAAMTGNIDEIRIYNLALSEAHITALYKLGLAGK